MIGSHRNAQPPRERLVPDISASGLDQTLSLLGSVQPRDGLQGRVLARIAAEPSLPWYRRQFTIASAAHHRWMIAAASMVIVAGGLALGVSSIHGRAPEPARTLMHAPHPARQAAAAAAAIAVPSHPLQTEPVHTRHRGVRRGYRATHNRVPLPHGAVAPAHPRLPRVQ